MWAVDQKQDISLLWPNSLHMHFLECQPYIFFTILLFIA